MRVRLEGLPEECREAVKTLARAFILLTVKGPFGGMGGTVTYFVELGGRQ